MRKIKEKRNEFKNKKKQEDTPARQGHWRPAQTKHIIVGEIRHVCSHAVVGLADDPHHSLFWW